MDGTTLEVDPQDLQLFKDLRDGGAIRHLDSAELERISKTGTVVAICSDADRFPDFFNHHCLCSGTERHHSLSLAGGPVTGTLGKKEILCEEVGIALHNKGIRTVVLAIHLPCLKCINDMVTFRDALSVVIDRKETIKEEFKPEFHGLKVVCLVHIYIEGKMKTYSFSTRAVQRFLSEN